VRVIYNYIQPPAVQRHSASTFVGSTAEDFVAWELAGGGGAGRVQSRCRFRNRDT
jgi:hypothetical protein